LHNSDHQNFSFGVVILAAGSSQRMGQPKLLLPWRDSTVLQHLIQTWNELGAGQIAVVSTERLQPLWNELDRLRFPMEDRIMNPDPDRGMFSSIQCAASWKGWRTELTHIVVTLGDQPHLKMDTLRCLLQYGRSHPTRICQPIRKGRSRHPVLFPQDIFREIPDSAVANLKEFLRGQGNKAEGFESDDEGLDWDMDTPADYEKLKQRDPG
jgi:molybdenum cofactor cytidylyltransferase